ncbi:uncharacterized protein LOC131617695 isoform X1 [Vicia villosa]|uniref:uncharacterized protein LOC131617695 isoform X1 n=1 Tax=Vicia villosa TaxID=3911 RepID=UPI00273C0B3C|nr:uncharacterized protein LOC131617695 isoform X1 [Vicia villosa]
MDSKKAILLFSILVMVLHIFSMVSARNLSGTSTNIKEGEVLMLIGASRNKVSKARLRLRDFGSNKQDLCREVRLAASKRAFQWRTNFPGRYAAALAAKQSPVYCSRYFCNTCSPLSEVWPLSGRSRNCVYISSFVTFLGYGFGEFLVPTPLFSFLE